MIPAIPPQAPAMAGADGGIGSGFRSPTRRVGLPGVTPIPRWIDRFACLPTPPQLVHPDLLHTILVTPDAEHVISAGLVQGKPSWQG
jgi:hypothetical protein